jgi:23S rRNA (adenine2503-C2)-methyltransferase
MSDLPESERSRLSAFGEPRVSRVLASHPDPDGTLKLEIGLFDGQSVECVMLTDYEGRKTACLSTQVGCPMACAFCKTGTLGFSRNLSRAEIVEQLYHLKTQGQQASNVVFMGMGEPLLNLEELRAAIAVIHHPDGLNISLRKITISTCGLCKGIRDLADSGPLVRLAVSLTTADPELRRRLMPVAASNPLPELKKALLYYQEKTQDRITLEAAIMGNANSRPEDVKAMVDFCRGLKAQVNLIPWNPVPELPFSEPKRGQIEDFERALTDAGLTVTRRMRRGRGVSGACGQLGSVKPRSGEPAPEEDD